MERWVLIRCLRLLSASLWLLDASADLEVSVMEAAGLRMESAPSRLTSDGSCA